MLSQTQLNLAEDAVIAAFLQNEASISSLNFDLLIHMHLTLMNGSCSDSDREQVIARCKGAGLKEADGGWVWPALAQVL